MPAKRSAEGHAYTAAPVIPAKRSADALRARGNDDVSTDRLAGLSLEGLEREGAGRTCLARVVRGAGWHLRPAPPRGSSERLR
jgi:hypothetical protein